MRHFAGPGFLSRGGTCQGRMQFVNSESGLPNTLQLKDLRGTYVLPLEEMAIS